MIMRNHHAVRRAALVAVALLALGRPAAVRAIDTDEVRLSNDPVHDGVVTLTRTEETSELVLSDAVAGSVTLAALKHAAQDHGALAGLDADDHPHYLTAARHADEHDAAANAALPIAPDAAGNTTLGAHLADTRLHVRRDAPETISGAWTWLGTAEHAGPLRLSAGGAAGTTTLAFARAAADALLTFDATDDRFELSRPLAVGGSVDMAASPGARVGLPGWTGVAGQEGRVVFDGSDDADTYLAATGGDQVAAYTDAVEALRANKFGVSLVGQTLVSLGGSGGSAGVPALARSGDADTGLYWSAANVVDVATGGVRAGGFAANGDLDARGRLVVAGTATSTFAGGVTVQGPVAAAGGFSSNGLKWQTGAGAPEGVVSAPVGSLYTRSDGTAGATLYVKEGGGSGPTGWAAK